MTSIDPLVVDEPKPNLDLVRPLPREGAYDEVIKAFGDVAAAISDFREIDDLLHLIAEKITELVGVRRCSLYLRDEASGVYRGQVGHWHEDIDQRVKRLISGVHADRFTTQILETKRPVVVQDTKVDPRPIRSTMRDWGVRSMLGVPMLLRDEVIGIVYLDDEDRPRSYDDQDAAIAFAFADLAAVAISQAQLTVALRERLNTVTRQNRAMRRAAEVEDRLTTLALDGCTVQEIVSAVAELTGHSVAVHDSAHGLVAGSAAPTADPSMLPRLLSPELRGHARVAEALRKAADGEPTLVPPLLDAGLHRRSLLAPVRVRGETWGSLVMAEYRGRLTSVDVQIGRRAATIVAWEVSAARQALGAAEDARSSLAAELLRGARDWPGLARRAEYLGIQLQRPYAICLVAAAGDGPPPDLVAVTAAFQAASGPEVEVLAADVAEGIAVLLGLPAAERGLNAVAADASERLTGGVLVAVSRVCASARDCPAALVDARQILHCLRKHCDPHVTILSAKDLGPTRVLLASSDPAQIELFAHETLGALIDGGPNERKLLRTLATFMDEGRSVRAAAAALDLHENTVRYRLARVEELTGLQVLTDSDDQLSAQLATMVLRLRSELPGAPI